MSLDEHDYFKWFSDEITRYRNLEWRIAGYSGAIFAIVALWGYGTGSQRNLIVPLRCPALGVVIIFNAFCFFAEWHIHDRLNHFRKAQEFLRENSSQPPEEALKVKHDLISGWRDGIYLCAFMGFIFLMGVFALYALWHV